MMLTCSCGPSCTSMVQWALMFGMQYHEDAPHDRAKGLERMCSCIRSAAFWLEGSVFQAARPSGGKSRGLLRWPDTD